jgi:RNA polymerase sigma-32 factor
MGTSLQAVNTELANGSLDAYIHRVFQIPVLSEDQEQQLAERWYYEQDLEAARELVLAHLRFVVRVARNYKGYGLSLADLIQEGNIGLMKAVKRFDPQQGVRLVSFAVHWIKAEIHDYIIRNWRIVKVATTKAQRKLFFNLRRFSKRLGWNSEQEVQEVANELNVSPKEVKEMEQRLNNIDVAFDGPTDTEDQEDAPMSPANYLPDHSEDPAKLLEDRNSYQSRHHQLSTALDHLDERSRDIVMRRWLGENKATLEHLSEEYGVSAERVRQLERNAMKKLKQRIGH